MRWLGGQDAGPGPRPAGGNSGADSAWQVCFVPVASQLLQDPVSLCGLSGVGSQCQFPRPGPAQPHTATARGSGLSAGNLTSACSAVIRTSVTPGVKGQEAPGMGGSFQAPRVRDYSCPSLEQEQEVTFWYGVGCQHY